MNSILLAMPKDIGIHVEDAIPSKKKGTIKAEADGAFRLPHLAIKSNPNRGNRNNTNLYLDPVCIRRKAGSMSYRYDAHNTNKTLRDLQVLHTDRLSRDR